MVDCGFSGAQLERRLARLGKRPQDLTAILVTHEHTDHASGVARLAKKYRLPVWMTAGTRAALAAEDLPGVTVFNAHHRFAIGALEVQPFPVPHDAREPCQYVFGDGTRRLGLLTDTGSLTAHIAQVLDACDALLLECNHDSALLAASAYPPALKQRIAGRYGHLSNAQAADLLGRLDCSRLQHLAALHLSEKNNTPLLARAALAAALGCAPDWIAVADQEAGLAWRQIG